MKNIKSKIELQLRKLLMANLEWYDKLPHTTTDTRSSFVSRVVTSILRKYNVEEKEDYKE